MGEHSTDKHRGTSNLLIGEFLGNRGAFHLVLPGGGMAGGIHYVEEGAPANLAS